MVEMTLARVAAKALIRLDPESSTPYVLLHNMCADIGQWDYATKVKKLMEKHNLKKAAGLAWWTRVPYNAYGSYAARILGFYSG
ncbi:Pentatricopeptide repeat-containing protein [Artemisia annua]|uniref:Pentatricopeptide repeat-containing protein n=1 Tax=Artemisia annua TaxID=35608 RepID=A0A2U1M1B2_ARTAN|nr:Pentatricopeptide repeat-containing protein [Artemisia annua]